MRRRIGPGVRRSARKKPPFRKRGVGGITPTQHSKTAYPTVIPPKAGIHPPQHHTRIHMPSPPPTVIPAQAGIQNPGLPSKATTGRGVDSRFRGNDGMGGRNDGSGGGNDGSGRGLGEGETLYAANPGNTARPAPPPFILRQAQDERLPTRPSQPPVIPTPIPSFPPHPVIPAKAGIHPPHRHTRPPPSFPRKRESTPRPTVTPGPTGALDSGLRRNDGEGAGMAGWGGNNAMAPECRRPAAQFVIDN